MRGQKFPSSVEVWYCVDLMHGEAFPLLVWKEMLGKKLVSV